MPGYGCMLESTFTPMSYLDTPRLHFSGRFYTDPSTINNNRANYNHGVTDPIPSWRPMGSGDFRFVDCVVASVFDAAGRQLEDDAADLAVGGPVGCREQGFGVAKLVDLDPDEQTVSTVIGMRLMLSLRETGQSITGDVDPVTMNGFWPNAMQQAGFNTWQGPDAYMAASFQTVMRVDAAAWPDTPGSPVWQALREACALVNGHRVVSLKFVLDGFINDARNPGSGTGRVVGTFGPWKLGEPIQCPRRRWLYPTLSPAATNPPPDWKSAWPPWDFASFNGAPFWVDEARKKLVIDLANSRQFVAPGGTTANLGRLEASIGPPAAGKIAEADILGLVDYSELRHRNAAGIAEVDLTDEQITQLAARPLVLTSRITALGREVVLAEDPEGLNYAVDQRVFRMAHDTPAIAELRTVAYVTRFGRPAAGVQLIPQLLPSVTGGVPEGSHCIDMEIQPSDSSGSAAIVLRAVANPGHPIDRPGACDGQIYKFQVLASPRKSGVSHGEQKISVHLYEDYPVPSLVVWSTVRDIFLPYKTLYPNMFERVDLTDPNTFDQFGESIAQRMRLPFEHPQYMPVTRDLSPHKSQAVLNFIDHPVRMMQLAFPPLPLQAAQFPYQLSFVEKQYPTTQAPLPALQSFCAARLPGARQWLLVSGQTKGIHGFAQPDDANTVLYAIDPETGTFHSFDLATLNKPSVTEPLSVTNAQSYYDDASGYYYQFGGYGFDGDSANFITFDVLTRFKLADMLAALAESPQQPARILSLIEQTHDERLAVTGGAVLPLQGRLVLAMGQKFTGVVADPMPPTTTMRYTEQVRYFRLRPGPVPGIDNRSYGATPDSGNHELHRRDFSAVAAIDPVTGEEHIKVCGGVFKFGVMEAFDHPLIIHADGTVFVDGGFRQRMNVYQCPVIAVYDPAARHMSHTFFGGISNWMPAAGGAHLNYSAFSHSNQVSMLARGADGVFHEYLTPTGIPGGLETGIDAVFLPHPDLDKNQQVYPNGVLRLDRFAAGSKSLIGHIYGGVETRSGGARAPVTQASSRVFEVYLDNSPGACLQIS